MGSSTILVFYYFQSEPGEDIRHPNVFHLSSTTSITFEQILHNFPVKHHGEFQWRFRTTIHGKKDYVWKDITNHADKVPLYGGNVFAKLLRLNTLKYSNALFIPKRIGISKQQATATTQPLQTIYVPTPPPSDGRSSEQRAADRIKQRKEEELRAQKRAVLEKQQVEQNEEKEQKERATYAKNLGPKLAQWSRPDGTPKNLRALLCTLHTVLWDGAKWKPVSVLVRAADVKSAYRKAILIVHEDKIKNANGQVRFIAQSVFDSLQEQWNVFSKAEMK